ncbi:type 4a pilus biogenesis protein PilO [Patescibacteria group bacterium]|nr:type 4a pilus biogenesis protein PilO [Patescibacteria group bacterium]
MPRPFIITIIILSVLVSGVFIIWPEYQELTDSRRKIEEKKAEVEIKKEYFSHLSEVSQNLEEYSEELSKINSALPNNPSIPALFDFLQKAASQNGLVLKNIGSFSLISQKPAQQSAPKPGEIAVSNFPASRAEVKMTEIYLDISLSGSYSSFKNFLSTLEKSSRLIEVENISFSSLQEQKQGQINNNATSSFNLKIKTQSY